MRSIFVGAVVLALVACGAREVQRADPRLARLLADREAAVLAAAQAFAQSGTKLVRLAFPRTEQQVYGDVAVLYSRYEFELEKNGKRSLQAGRATEVFVWRDSLWQNTGWHLDSGH